MVGDKQNSRPQQRELTQDGAVQLPVTSIDLMIPAHRPSLARKTLGRTPATYSINLVTYRPSRITWEKRCPETGEDTWQRCRLISVSTCLVSWEF